MAAIDILSLVDLSPIPVGIIVFRFQFEDFRIQFDRLVVFLGIVEIDRLLVEADFPSCCRNGSQAPAEYDGE